MIFVFLGILFSTYANAQGPVRCRYIAHLDCESCVAPYVLSCPNVEGFAKRDTVLSAVKIKYKTKNSENAKSITINITNTSDIRNATTDSGLKKVLRKHLKLNDINDIDWIEVMDVFVQHDQKIYSNKGATEGFESVRSSSETVFISKEYKDVVKKDLEINLVNCKMKEGNKEVKPKAVGLKGCAEGVLCRLPVKCSYSTKDPREDLKKGIERLNADAKKLGRDYTYNGYVTCPGQILPVPNEKRKHYILCPSAQECVNLSFHEPLTVNTGSVDSVYKGWTELSPENAKSLKASYGPSQGVKLGIFEDVNISIFKTKKKNCSYCFSEGTYIENGLEVYKDIVCKSNNGKTCPLKKACEEDKVTRGYKGEVVKVESIDYPSPISNGFEHKRGTKR